MSLPVCQVSLPRLANSFGGANITEAQSCVRKKIEFASLPRFLCRGGPPANHTDHIGGRCERGGRCVVILAAFDDFLGIFTVFVAILVAMLAILVHELATLSDRF